MSFNVDIFNRQIQASRSDYDTYSVVVTADLLPYATIESVNTEVILLNTSVEELSATTDTRIAELSTSLNVQITSTNDRINSLSSTVDTKFLPLTGGRLSGNLTLSGDDGQDKSLILYSPTVNASAELKAAITFIGFNPGTGQFEPEPGVSFPRILIREGRLDFDPDTIFTRAEFRVSNPNAEFNIYNKDAAKYYLRIRPNGGFDAGGTNLNATGDSSHCEGISTTASASASHAEGFNTQASDNYSHAEGNTTSASNEASHAEGFNTQASGLASHAEGNGTEASGLASHAEGNGTEASGTFSHAEGASTRASGDYSHAEGQSTIASGIRSHAEGDTTLASGEASHAEGVRTRARGIFTHAAGQYAEAAHEGSWFWRGTTQTTYLSTTQQYQFMVRAEGGIALYDQVGIGTDSADNALTVVGDISATNTVYASAVALSSVTFTSETSIQPMSATDIYIKVIVGNQERYLPLFALSAI